MTAGPSINPMLRPYAEFLHEQLAQASPDLMRELLATFIDALLSAPRPTRCAAPATAPAARSGSTAATATGTATWTPGSARSTSPCRSCAPGPYFPEWLLSAAAAPSRR